MKKIFSFIALAFLSVAAFAQTCVETDVNLTGTASITFTRYEHKNLTGVFSVAADKQVIFSQGNLQYQASTNTWRFAEHQWDVANGNSTASGRDTQSKWISLYGWGTSGWDNGADVYVPYATETESANYTAEYLVSSFAESDWAWHNVIINGGVSSEGPVNHTWRLFTMAEWQYLVERNSRTLFGLGTLNGVDGLFLLPDNWDWSETTIADAAAAYNNFEFVAGDASLTSYSNNVIENTTLGASFWEVLENAGVVFLPTEGYRTGLSVIASTRGYYWTSSSSDGVLAVQAYFNLNACGISRSNRSNGACVRPIRDL